MTILEYHPTQDDILDCVNDGIRQLQDAGSKAAFIVVGTEAYERMRQAMAARFHRKPGTLESYQYIPVVLDPFRTDGLCVLPDPGECAKGVGTYRVEA